MRKVEKFPKKVSKGDLPVEVWIVVYRSYFHPMSLDASDFNPSKVAPRSC
jgi:hypothetical protein